MTGGCIADCSPPADDPIATGSANFDLYDGCRLAGTAFHLIGSSGTTQSLEKVPLGDGCPLVLVNMPGTGSGAVAVDDEWVYWSNSEGIFNLAKAAVGPFHQ